MCDSDSDFELALGSDVENDVLNVKKSATTKAGKKVKSKGKVLGDVDSNRRTSMERAQLSSKYQKKTQYEHIMLRPDTYIGSVEVVTQPMWVFENNQMTHRATSYVPGLYKIFDEILVNASDNKQRDPAGMRGIKVTIDPSSGEISVWNDGKGIPVEIHREHGMYIPELIFGHLMTGENFEDTQQRVVGGRNGYGAKLANIFSTRFVVETNDSKSGKRYVQEWTDNMSCKKEPKISKASGKDFTCITFIPDYARFGMPDGLDADTLALLTKRVYDTAGVTEKSVKVSLNGKALKINTFDQYIELYLPDEDTEKASDEDNDSDFSDGESATKKKKKKTSAKKVVKKVYERANERWEVCLAASPDGQMAQVSFVNGICTTKGGQHVNYIADQAVSSLQSVLKKKHKGGTELKSHQIKSHLWIFVNALIVNPAFDSQTKETLTTVKSKFGPASFLPKLSDKSLKLLEKTTVVENILYWAKAKEMKELSKKAGGAKKSKLKGIDKLDDANNAGGRLSHQCTLILTEGDSAKTLAISGLSVVGRDNYGVFPLRGKLLNVRDASHSQIMKNEEVQNVMKIMGLQPGKKYSSSKELRYGHLMVMTDQDHDGSHIKGLLMNLVHHFWPSLLEIPGFLQVFVTPIVKVTKGAQCHSFYTMPQYAAWLEGLGGVAERKRWTTKYYKGLGTSTAKEAKEYFANIQRNRIKMAWEGDAASEALELAFSKKKVNARKEWLANFEPGTFVDFDVQEMDYVSFVNKELILFSMADNMRSIPSMVDGLKPSQRKVLFSCFKRRLKTDIKVAQLVGYVSEHSAYHHGEVSLASTVVGMAQTFVGSNNVNYLFPSGQFGSRILGGKDAASARYIFTRLAPLTRHIFHPHDDAVLRYLEDDGMDIEPEYYAPVIPSLLVNGASGIGTGWSTDIPCFNPRDIVAHLRRKLIACEPTERLAPWYKGFTGEIQPEIHHTKGFTGRYKVTGIFERDEDEEAIIISELPVGTWTQAYKQFLADEKVFPEGFIKDVRENHTDTSVSFTIQLGSQAFRSLEHDDVKLVKLFRLETSVSTSNMIAFNPAGVITRYDTAEEIVDEFFEYRIGVYRDRKAHIETCLQSEWSKLDNKARFITMVVNEEIVITKRKKAELLAQLESLGFDKFEKPAKKANNAAVTNDGLNASDGEDTNGAATTSNDSDRTVSLARGYDYLLSMALWTLTMEKVAELEQQRDSKRAELDTLKAKKPHDLWEEDLVALEEALDRQEQIDAEEAELEASQRRGGKGKRAAKKAPTIKRAPAPKTKRVPITMQVIKKKPMTAAACPAKTLKAPSRLPARGLIDAMTSAEEDAEIEEEILSLSERLKMRMLGSSSPKTKIKAASANMVETAVVVESDDDGNDMMSLPTPPPKASKKRVKACSTAKKPDATKKRPGRKKKLVDSSEEESDFSLADVETPAPKPAKHKRRLNTAKKSKDDELFSEEEEDDEGSDQIEAAVPSNRPARARRAPVKSNYVELSDSDEESEAEDESDFEVSD